LVVNEAMAKGLPVITTDRCIAGLTLITSSDLGSIVPIEDVDALADAIEETFSVLSTEMNESVLRAIRSYTIEKMAKLHMEIFDKN
jgi:glycosyltransferase involved in cell wall biosynthesis